MNTINYNVPILTESFGDDEFLITGIAINATTTDNNHKFLAEELRSSASSLKNKPLLTDHNDTISAIAGKVINAEFDELSKSIKFKAKLNNTEQGKLARQLIKDGDLNTVSIGANVERFEEDMNVMIPRGIKFKELSLVATPADDNATFNLIHNDFISALNEAWKNNKKSINKINEKMHDCPECEMEFESKKELDKHMEAKHKSNSSNEKLNYRRLNMEKGEESTESMNIEVVKVEENREIESVKNDISNLQNNILEFSKQLKSQTDILSQVLSDFKKLQESDVEEVQTIKVVEKPKAKEEVINEDIDEGIEENSKEEVGESGYKIVQGYKSFTVERNKYK